MASVVNDNQRRVWAGKDFIIHYPTSCDLRFSVIMGRYETIINIHSGVQRGCQAAAPANYIGGESNRKISMERQGVVKGIQVGGLTPCMHQNLRVSHGRDQICSSH